MTNHNKRDYKRPETEASAYIPALLCDSLVDGGSEDIVDENWDF